MLSPIPPPFDEKTKALRKFKERDPKGFAKALDNLSGPELESILYDGDLWLRENQIFDHYPESIVFFMGGRGTGKSFAGSYWVRKMVEEHGAKNIGIIGQTAFDTKNVMVLGPSGILNAFPPSQRPEFSPANRTITFVNGAKAYVFSAQDGDKVRGNNFDALWGDEICTWDNDDVFHQAALAVRSGISKILLTSTPKPTKLIIDLWKRRDKDVRFIQGTTYENLSNLSKSYKEQIIATYENTRIGQQELEGKLILTAPGALWTQETIDSCIVDKEDLPQFKRVCVGVDPSGGSKSGNDACGIVVAGLGVDDVVYILEDATEVASPYDWARKVVRLYDKYEADIIVYERNYGNEMIQAIFDPIRKNLPLKDEWAKKGKLIRAEGPSLLYEKGQVKHVKGLLELEEEMTTYDGTGKSPNRLDAMVYCVQHLTNGQKRHVSSSEFLF